MVTPYPALPQTSSAVNIQIIEPKNFPGGATPGQILPGGAPTYPTAPAYGAPAGYPANYNNISPGLTPGLPPQQQLQEAYTNAMNARNAAEQARAGYLNLANQLNNQAYNPYYGYGVQPQYAPQQPFVNYAPNYYYPQPQAVPGPFGPQPQAAFPQFPPQGPQAFPPQAQQPFQPPAPEQQPPLPEQTPAEKPPEEQKSEGLKGASLADLNRMISAPQTLQEKIDAMEELGVRGQADPTTYQALQQEALADTSQLTGQAQDDANYVRQAALWTLGMLNAAQNGATPADKLPGLTTIQQILGNKAENKDVKLAAIQALQVMNRSNEKSINKILKKAAKDKDPYVQQLAQKALAGQTIPMPTA